MTESLSDAVEVADQAEPSDSVANLSLNGMRVFTSVTMEVYRQAALANYTEAEDLLHRAMELREAGHALLDRAATLAGQYAILEDGREELVEEAFAEAEDHIQW